MIDTYIIKKTYSILQESNIIKKILLLLNLNKAQKERILHTHKANLKKTIEKIQIHRTPNVNNSRNYELLPDQEIG